MNFMQKAWLKVLTPVSYVVNEKMATRPGMIGRFGRFFAIGPREYGAHSFNNMMGYLNAEMMYMLQMSFHRSPMMRSWTGTGFHYVRPMSFVNFFMYFLVFNLMVIPIRSGYVSLTDK